MTDVSTTVTKRKRNDNTKYDRVTSYDRSQGSYQLRPNVQNRIETSIKGGNQFAALALLVLSEEAFDASEDESSSKNATYMAPEPQTRRQAMSGMEADEWLKAESTEISSMRDNNVFIECRLPKGRKAIHSKWVYKRKRV